MPTITMIDKSTPQQTLNTTGSSSAKDRAIALLTSGTGNAQAHPVSNPSSVSAEDIHKNVTETEVDTGQNDTVEATPPVSKEEPISSQYAVLARKEKAIRAKAIAQEQSFKAREAAIAAREAEVQAKSEQDLTQYIHKDRLKQNAYNAMLEAGVSYDELTQQALAAQSPEAQYLRQMREEMNQEIQKLREEQGKTRQSIEQQQTQAYQQALTQIRNEATQLVNSDPSYETVKVTRSVKDVVDLIERTFKEDGTLLTVEQAAEAVEEHLIEEAMKLSQIGKIKERMSRNASAKPQASSATQTPAAPGNNMKTLTNSVGSTRPLSARERALLAFKGELK